MLYYAGKVEVCMGVEIRRFPYVKNVEVEVSCRNINNNNNNNNIRTASILLLISYRFRSRPDFSVPQETSHSSSADLSQNYHPDVETAGYHGNEASSSSIGSLGVRSVGNIGSSGSRKGLECKV